MLKRSNGNKNYLSAGFLSSVILGGLFLANFDLKAEALPSAKTSIDLEIKKTWSIPLKEISGLSLADKTLYLASDKTSDFLSIPLENKGLRDIESSKASAFPLNAPKAMKLTKKSQWEALAIDKAGNFFAIKETKDQIFQFTREGQANRLFQLMPFDGRKSQRKGFEGLLLMKNSHFLIALSSPPILIEYGPKGDKALGVNRDSLLLKDETFILPKTEELYPLASWTLESPKDCEMSDLSMSSLGSVLILLKDCFHIVRAAKLDPAKNSFTPEQIWNYPEAIDHAEGLIETNDAFMISVDQIAETNNLFWVESKAKDFAPKKAP